MPPLNTKYLRRQLLSQVFSNLTIVVYKQLNSTTPSKSEEHTFDDTLLRLSRQPVSTGALAIRARQLGRSCGGWHTSDYPIGIRMKSVAKPTSPVNTLLASSSIFSSPASSGG